MEVGSCALTDLAGLQAALNAKTVGDAAVIDTAYISPGISWPEILVMLITPSRHWI